jgi:hypothetical protein
MEHPKTDNYKTSLYLAFGIFAFCMCLATGSRAHDSDPRLDGNSISHQDKPNELPTITSLPGAAK